MEGHILGEGAAVNPLVGDDGLAEYRVPGRNCVTFLPTDSTIPAMSVPGIGFLGLENPAPITGGHRVAHSRRATHPGGSTPLVRARGLRDRRPPACRLPEAPDHREIRTSLGRSPSSRYQVPEDVRLGGEPASTARASGAKPLVPVQLAVPLQRSEKPASLWAGRSRSSAAAGSSTTVRRPVRRKRRAIRTPTRRRHRRARSRP